MRRVPDAVRAATWRTGNLELWDPRGAARGGSTRPAVARSARAGRARAAAMASPMARRRASPAGAGMRLQLRRVLTARRYGSRPVAIHWISHYSSGHSTTLYESALARIRGSPRRCSRKRPPHRVGAAHALVEGTDIQGSAVTARSHRPSDLPAPEHARIASAATGRRERPGGTLTPSARPAEIDDKCAAQAALDPNPMQTPALRRQSLADPIHAQVQTALRP